MILHSTNQSAPKVTLARAAASGIAPDGGLYLPDTLPRIPRALFNNIAEMSLREVAYVVTNTLFESLAPADALKRAVDDALDYPMPLRETEPGRYVLELFHGPTLSFKDAGARLMARLLPLAVPAPEGGRDIIVATSGDSGGAVADGFKDAPDTRVTVLFPKGELSRQQVAQFATLPRVTAVEVDGTFDDCQGLAVDAVRRSLTEPGTPPLISANSVNPLRQLPAIICYFHAYAEAARRDPSSVSDLVVSIPCGNLGNLSAALMAKSMGLPVKRFIAANNANDEFVEYLTTGGFTPRKTLMTLARAMDVGNPSNLARIIDLYGGDLDRLRADVAGASVSDDEIARCMRRLYSATGYMLDPQGAAAYSALDRLLRAGETGIAIASASPALFADTMESVLGTRPAIPPELSVPAGKPIRVHPIPPAGSALRRVLAAARARHSS